MRLLLDTHVLLWWLTDDGSLSDEVADLIDDGPDVHVSAVTVWEIAIKQSVGKINGPQRLLEHVSEAGFVDLPITSRHAVAAGRLPLLHRDPFDRMLVAQAQVERLTLITRDKLIAQYDVPILGA